jgi:transcription elongation factor Elf1
MSTELLFPEIEAELESKEIAEKTTQDIEQEIECPRCHDVMALSSEFDKLLYFCQECGLSLVMK